MAGVCAVVQRQLLNHGKLYVAFSDVKKAFDLLDRSDFWTVPRKNGVRGKMFTTIQNIAMLLKQESVLMKTGFIASSKFKARRNVQPDFVFSLHL